MTLEEAHTVYVLAYGPVAQANGTDSSVWAPGEVELLRSLGVELGFGANAARAFSKLYDYEAQLHDS